MFIIAKHTTILVHLPAYQGPASTKLVSASKLTSQTYVQTTLGLDVATGRAVQPIGHGCDNLLGLGSKLG